MRKDTTPPTEDLPADPAELGQGDGKSSGPATDPAPAGVEPEPQSEAPERPLIEQIDDALLKAILAAVTPGTQPGTDFVDADLAQRLAVTRATVLGDYR